MKTITILDTSICSLNVGDFIIMDGVNKQLKSIFPDAMKLRSYTHDKISTKSYALIKQSDYAFIGGTNLLSSNMNKYNQWRVNLIDTLFVKSLLLLGVGWWQYQAQPNAYTKLLLTRLLHSDLLHSVRDSYTEKMLKSVGFKNVINTSCPTMWELTPEFCSKISTNKADKVVFTITDYNKSSTDKDLISILQKNYTKLYFWPQGIGDLAYYNKNLYDKNIEIVAPNLEALNSLLQSGNIDFVGTRLHAGIRSLQNKIRTIIVAIDNRALEKGKDFNIPICSRDRINEDLHLQINSRFSTEVTIPEQHILKWKQQFK